MMKKAPSLGGKHPIIDPKHLLTYIVVFAALYLPAFYMVQGINGLSNQIDTLSAYSTGSAAVVLAQASNLPADYGTDKTMADAYPAYCPSLSYTLQKGTRDADVADQVSELQHFISGYYNIDPTEIMTGYFGSVTQSFVSQFQKANDLPALGIVGPLTRAVIAQVCNSSGVSQPPAPISSPASVSTIVGSLTLSTDPSSPGYQIVTGGTTGVVLGVFKIRTAGEAINLSTVGLVLSSDTAYAGDLVNVSLYAGATQIGSGVFVGGSNTMTITLYQYWQLPQDTDQTITVKGDVAAIGTGRPARAGDLIRVLITSAQGTGVSSRQTVSVGQLDSAPSTLPGVRIFRSYPTVALMPLPNSGLADGRLLRFSITATPSGSIGIAQLGFTISGNSSASGQADLYAYTDSAFASPVSGFTAGGLAGAAVIGSGGFTRVSLLSAHPLEIPAGATYYFELRDSTKGAGIVNGATALTTTLDGEVGYQGLSAYNSAYQNGPLMAWSPNDNTTSQFSDSDWTNGYGVAGLPVGGISQTRTGDTSTGPVAALNIDGRTGGVTLNVGDNITWYWSSVGGVSAVSTYTADGPFCGYPATGSWIANSLSGAQNLASVPACQAGHTVIYTYTVTAANGSKATRLVVVKVNPPKFSEAPTASIMINGSPSAFGVYHVGDVINWSWSSTGGVSATSYATVDTDDTCGNKAGVHLPSIANGLSGLLNNYILPACTANHSYTWYYAVTDASGRTATSSVTALVTAATAPSCTITAPDTGTIGVPFSFVWSSTNTTAMSAVVTLNGATLQPTVAIATTGNLSSTLNTPGIYTWSFTATGPGGTGSCSKTITFSNAPTASASDGDTQLASVLTALQSALQGLLGFLGQ